MNLLTTLTGARLQLVHDEDLCKKQHINHTKI